MEESLKIFLIKLLGWFFLFAVIIGGIWYLQLFIKKPAFHPIKMALNLDENIAHIISTEGLAVFDNEKNKISVLTSDSFSPDANIVMSKTDSRTYVADHLNDKILVYKAGALLKEITVGSRPRFIFLSDETQKLFVFNRFSRDLSVIDTKNYDVTATIEIGSDVLGGALDEKSNYLYLIAENGGIFKISIDNLKFSEVANVGPFSGGYEKIPFDEINQRMYFASKGDDQLWIINTASGKVINNVKVPSGSEVITMDSTKKKLYIANSDEHTVFIFDADNLQLKKIPLSPLLYPVMALADEEGGRLYVYSRSRIDEITVLDMEGKAIKDIPLGYPLSDFQFSYKTKTLYALSRAGGFMLTVKNGKEKFYNRKPEIKKTKLSWPNRLEVGILSKRLYAVSDFSNKLLSFEPKSLDLTGELDLGGGPYSMFFSSSIPDKSNPANVYVINRGINEIWRIDTWENGAPTWSLGNKIKIKERIFQGIGLSAVKKLYVTSEDSLIVIDSQKEEVIKTIKLDEDVKIIGGDKDQKKAFIQKGDSAILVIDGSTDEIKSEINVGNIAQTVFDATNSKIYILGSDNKSLKIIDTNMGKIVKNVSLGDEYNNFAAAPWIKRLYFLSSINNELLVLNSDSLKEIAIINININKSSTDVLSQITGIYPDEKTNTIFATHRYGQITVIDPTLNKIITTINLPYSANPVSLKTDPEAGRLYVANKWLSNIQIFDLKDYLLVAEINSKGETQWYK